MLKGNDIVYVSNDWFTENKTSSHQIAERLAENGNRILYVEAAGLRKPRASKRDIRKIFKKIWLSFKAPRTVAPNVHVYSPLVIPFHRFKIIRKINELLSTLSVKWGAKRVGIKNPILWIVLPHYYYLAKKMNEKGIVYYCVDEYSTLPNADNKIIKEFELALLQKANVVFAVSTVLVQSKKKLNKNTFYSPHGVDIDHFKKALEPELAIPMDICKIPKPILGFFGLLEHWVDYDLIKFIASERPNVSIVLIGKTVQDTAELSILNNIYLMGWKNYQSLPAYLKAFDVAIIPFRVNELIINSNPLKLKEYLAAGKPVVTVRIPAVEEYEHLAYVADDYHKYLEAIDLAINETDYDKKNSRVQAMENESWEARIETISQIVSKNISGVSNI
jgi:glycosyltransferase involved in cell wall biosynthesis